MQLLDVCELIIDCEHKTAPTQNSGYPSIRTPNIGNGYFILEKVNRVSEETYKMWTRRAVPQPGDLIMAREAPVGNVAMIPEGLRPCLGQRTLLIRPDRAKVQPSFLNYFLNGPHVQGIIHAKTSGATVAHLNMKDVRTMDLPTLPPLRVQRRIAGILSAYDELIENSQRRIRILETMARALYRAWLVNFRFPGHEKVPLVASTIGDIPQDWEAVSLASLVDFAKGRKPKETRKEALSGDVPLLLIDSLRGSQAEFASPDKLVLAGARDTIMVMDGGSSCDVTMGFAGAVGSTLGRFRTTCPSSFSPHALYRFLEAKADEFKSKNIGAAIPHANKDYILSQFVALPPEVIASSFHDQLEPIQGTVETLKAQIQNLRRTRDLLLPRLLSGQVAISNSE